MRVSREKMGFCSFGSGFDIIFSIEGLFLP
jgi:hypothetical protein